MPVSSALAAAPRPWAALPVSGAFVRAAAAAGAPDLPAGWAPVALRALSGSSTAAVVDDADPIVGALVVAACLTHGPGAAQGRPGVEGWVYVADDVDLVSVRDRLAPLRPFVHLALLDPPGGRADAGAEGRPIVRIVRRDGPVAPARHLTLCCAAGPDAGLPDGPGAAPRLWVASDDATLLQAAPAATPAPPVGALEIPIPPDADAATTARAVAALGLERAMIWAGSTEEAEAIASALDLTGIDAAPLPDVHGPRRQSVLARVRHGDVAVLTLSATPPHELVGVLPCVVTPTAKLDAQPSAPAVDVRLVPVPGATPPSDATDAARLQRTRAALIAQIGREGPADLRALAASLAADEGGLAVLAAGLRALLRDARRQRVAAAHAAGQPLHDAWAQAATTEGDESGSRRKKRRRKRRDGGAPANEEAGSTP